MNPWGCFIKIHYHITSPHSEYLTLAFRNAVFTFALLFMEFEHLSSVKFIS